MSFDTASMLSAIGFTLSQSCCLLTPVRHFVHHSIDTLYFALCLTLITPSFILSDYSLDPAPYIVLPHELAYFAICGLITWLFVSQFTQLLYQSGAAAYDASGDTRPPAGTRHFFQSQPWAALHVVCLAWLIAKASELAMYGPDPRQSLWKDCSAALVVLAQPLTDMIMYNLAKK